MTTTKKTKCNKCGEDIPLDSTEHPKCGWASTYTAKAMKVGEGFKGEPKPTTSAGPATSVGQEGGK